jgi:hypothetical protein
VEVRFRLIRATDVPATNPEGDAYDFGLQDTKGTLQAPQRLADGRLAFDFALTAKPGKEADRPNFTGVFASGPADDRFVYLAWRSVPRGVWVNRLKARLRDIDWPLARQASETGAVLVADLTGLPPGGGNRPVDWRLVDG